MSSCPIKHAPPEVLRARAKKSYTNRGAIASRTVSRWAANAKRVSHLPPGRSPAAHWLAGATNIDIVGFQTRLLKLQTPVEPNS